MIKTELEHRLDSLYALIEDCQSEQITLVSSSSILKFSINNDELLKILIREKQIVLDQLAFLTKRDREFCLKFNEKQERLM